MNHPPDKEACGTGLCLVDRIQDDHEERGERAEEQRKQEPVEAAAVLGLGQSGVDQGQRAPAHEIRRLLWSGDSDLVPALEMVKIQWPRKRLVVYVPSRHPLRGAAVELRSAADRHKTFPQALLKVCQFPAELSDGRGGVIREPIEW